MSKSDNNKQKASKVTRIKATDEKPVETVKKMPVTKKAPKKNDETTSKNPLVALGRYFKGAWVELRQVRWPNRKATWSLTLAVLLFTAFFAVVILLLDAGFKLLFEKILG